MGQIFGEYIRSLREKRRLTLRKFCLASGVDSSFYCKVENGVARPPLERLADYYRGLGIAEDSAEAKELARLASIDRGEIPAGIRNDPEMMGRMPVLFRTIEEGRLTGEDLERVFRAVREG